MGMFGALGGAMKGMASAPAAATAGASNGQMQDGGNGGGGLFNALLQRAMPQANAQPPAMGPGIPPAQPQGQANGVPFGGKPEGPGQGIWSKMMGKPHNRNTSQPPVQNGQPVPNQPVAGPGGPAMPPNPPSRVPPAAERFANGQQIQQAYANGWQPNPILLRASLGR